MPNRTQTGIESKVPALSNDSVARMEREPDLSQVLVIRADQPWS